MANNRRNRDRRKGRRSPFLDPKPRILVVCEGKETEPQYLKGFRSACHNPLVDVEVAKGVGVPKTVVSTAKELKKKADEAAKREKDDNLQYEKVWAVFDVDEHPKISDAIQMARDNDIELAISNPSFELWLLLHFADSPGMKSRQAVRDLLDDHIKDYDKHVDFNDYKNGYQQAATRASRLSQTDKTKCVPGDNPSTGVYLLTTSIGTP